MADVQIILHPLDVIALLDRMTDEEAGELEAFAAGPDFDPEAYIVRASQWLIAKFGVPGAPRRWD